MFEMVYRGVEACIGAKDGKGWTVVLHSGFQDTVDPAARV